MFEQLAIQDFNRAYRRAFWRKLAAWLTGKSNKLLAYEAVRRQLPFVGQRDLGLQTIPLDRIVGSVGRYHDFDRAFLPTQTQTTQRWINIKTARYGNVNLPVIEVYQIGEVYFVKDGNHRVSVAREQGQTDIDAFVTEISVPVPVTPETDIDELMQQRRYAQFLQETGLRQSFPDLALELSDPADYDRLRRHIETHRWYLGVERSQPVGFEEAAGSWVEHVYRPLLTVIEREGLAKAFNKYTLADLYLWVSEYQWLRRETYERETSQEEAAQKLMALYTQKPVRKMIKTLQRATWLDDLILEQERHHFLDYTHINERRPEADIQLTLPGKYGKLLHHISAHRWYMGESRGGEVPYEEAVASWYDDAYRPLVTLIREQDILGYFPDRTESDLYLWVVDHHQDFNLESYLAEIEAG